MCVRRHMFIDLIKCLYGTYISSTMYDYHTISEYQKIMYSAATILHGPSLFFFLLSYLLSYADMRVYQCDPVR